jgi:nucleoside diphosphate kinase
MLDFFKRLFGGRNHSEDIAQGMIERSQKWQVIGTEIAEDCFINGLSQGEIVKLSDITNLIAQNHSYNSSVVENSFLNQMMAYMDQGTVVNFNVEGGDTVFVHKDHVNDILEE